MIMITNNSRKTSDNDGDNNETTITNNFDTGVIVMTIQI